MTITDIYSYLLGNYRYRLYYSSRLLFLMRDHIYQQISYRILSMSPLCFNQGSCILCGCTTTALQMANKPCNGMEYPPMMTKREWNRGSTIWYHNKLNKKNYVFIKHNSRYEVFEDNSVTITKVETPISYKKVS